MAKKDLWLRLKHYHFDDLVPAHLADRVAAMFSGTDASTKAFASKLSRKLHWSPAFALRVIDEYKKFVYLGNVGTMSVTPSKVIDQVWHEHLLFSRGYRAFCRDVLGRDFDHNPELVPIDTQTGVFEAQYLGTLDAYRTEFNVDPPADIWDVAKFKRPASKVTTAPPKAKRNQPDRWSDDTPLHMYFSGGGGSDAGSSEATPEFGGGGGFSGAGAGRAWGDDNAHSHTHSDSTSHGHDSGSDSGDSGGSDGGGSSCSSSCGGGSD